MGQKPFDVRYALTSCVAHFHTRVSREIVGKGTLKKRWLDACLRLTDEFRTGGIAGDVLQNPPQPNLTNGI
jgi:hypothetical protein